MKAFTNNIFISLLLYYASLEVFATTEPCALRTTKYGSVCVCNVTYCDYLEENDILPIESDDFAIVSSSKAGLRFSYLKGNFHQESIVVEDAPKHIELEDSSKILKQQNSDAFIFDDAVIKINRNVSYQKIVGFGGSFTGAVSHNLDQLPEEIQNHVFRSYYSKNSGISYNMMRMPIGGCDFDLKPWAYNENPVNDVNLTSFSQLDERDLYRLSQIQKLKEISNNYDIKHMSSAWSPPPWMKSNNDWTGFSSLKKEFYQTWADYHLRYLELMEANNVKVWAITTGNEPLNGVIGWMFVHFMSLGWTPKNQAIWVGENLGPTLKNSKFKDVKIFGNDDQRYTFPTWFKLMERTHENSTSYLDGLAVHWYWDMFFPPNLIAKTHELYKDKIIINTESSVGDKPLETHGPELGSWDRGEKYANYYMEDLQNWVNGWIDWNLILNDHGGPNYVNNFVDSAVIYNNDNTEIYKQPIFYAIGHYSKFLPEGSIRIESSGNSRNIKNVAFLRPDGNIAVIILNKKNKLVKLKIVDELRGNIMISIPPRSVHTLIFK
ncbi:lysosomal acid glucosylceramidase [Condylostylus longicornis]|uniref:lysosomal acid glucosylceramidase n=1 Tax=Condylostylus longicornis TaxID=2530218 RepID=UPI00244DA290|nr:lysosomal acid glucosylceramidase [Condylostylus longicornis]